MSDYDFFHPDKVLLIKIGSALVHADEGTSENGHPYDMQIFRQLMTDPDVAKWIAEGTAQSFLPVKRV